MPSAFSYVILCLMFFLYFLKKWSARQRWIKIINYKSLILAVVFFRIFFALLKTFDQYYVWSQNEFAKFLLPPYQPLGYFLFYSWGHFWLNAVLSLGAAAIFYLALDLLKKYQPRFFDKRDTQLGLMGGLLTGWPLIIIFVPLFLVIAVLVTIFRQLVLKENLTPLGGIFLVATFLTIFLGNQLIKILDLGVLII